MLTRRDMLAAGCALGARAFAGDSLLAQAPAQSPAGPSVARDPSSYVNPQFRAAVLNGPLKNMPSSMDAAMLRAMRTAPAPGMMPPPLAEPKIVERTVPGAPGAPPVRVLVVGARAGASRPAVLHIHGGGYILGTAAAGGRELQELATSQDCVVISVDYRLAPETHFPGSLEDIYAALRWLHTNAKELGVDVTRVAVKGESAGGGLAAALAIAARDRGEFPLCFQVLIYPMLDDRTGSTRPVPPYLGHYLWTPEKNRFGWTALLGVPAGSNKVPAGSVPARVDDLSGLPPTFIGVGSVDLFAPEDLDYARRLLLAGVSVQTEVVPGAFHAFDGVVPDAPLSVRFRQTWTEALRRAFAVS